MAAYHPSATPVPRRSGRAAAAVIVAAVSLAGLLVAGHAGLLPKAPGYTGDPADQYRSSQSLGERLADR